MILKVSRPLRTLLLVDPSMDRLLGLVQPKILPKVVTNQAGHL